jgi:hypothetical protein
MKGVIKMKFRFMIGVLEGYGHENNGLTLEKQYELGKKAYMEAKNIDNVEDINDAIQVASAIYLQDWGCPVGGEGGIQITGEAESMEEVEGLVQKMMPILGQSTCTIEFEDDNCHSLGSSYVKNQGNDIDRNDAVDAERYSVKFPVEDVESMQQLGERLQTAVKVVGAKTGIYATGILTEGYDEKSNRRYYEYRGGN